MAGADVDWNLLEGRDAVFVYDNEQRNKQIIDRISQTIDKGYEVVIWPDNLEEKDERVRAERKRAAMKKQELQKRLQTKTRQLKKSAAAGQAPPEEN